MERISSGQTFFMKRVFPAFWLGAIALAAVVLVIDRGTPPLAMFVVPVAMLAIGGVVFRKLLWDLADEVRDGGSFLLVRRGGIEERIPLANVVNVSVSQFTNPRRLALRLRTRGKLGDEIVFIPKASLRFNPFARDPVAEALIARVDRARQQAVQP